MATIKIMAIGDVVGRPGRRLVRELVVGLRARLGLSFVVANGENAAGGSGITRETAEELLDSGVDVITTGDHFYDQRSVSDLIETEPNVLRPANWSQHAPGKGYGVFEAADGLRIGVANLMGRVFIGTPADNPFDAADRILDELVRSTNIILVDFHAEATSEKITLARYIDGRASFVFGTHTHVQTADEKILPKGSAYISDLGMTGPHDSVLGRDYEQVLVRMRAGTPSRFEVAKGDLRLQGAVVEIDAVSGRSSFIERVDVPLPD